MIHHRHAVLIAVCAWLPLAGCNSGSSTSTQQPPAKPASTESAATEVVQATEEAPATATAKVQPQVKTKDESGQVAGWEQLGAEVTLNEHQQITALRFEDGVDEAVLSKLAELTALEQLDLSWTDLKKLSLAPLASLNTLKRLDVSWSDIDDSVVDQLASVTQLETLIVEGTDLSSDGLTRLQTALPKARIRKQSDVSAEVSQKPALPDDLQRLVRESLAKNLIAGSEELKQRTAKVLELAAADPENPAAVQGLAWVNTVGAAESKQQAVELLLNHHVDNPQMAMIAFRLAQSVDPDAEAFLTRVMEDSGTEAVSGMAAYALAAQAGTKRELLKQLKANPQLEQPAKARYGSSTINALLQREVDDLKQEAVELLEIVTDRYAGVTFQGTSLSQIAEDELYALKFLQVGCEAPEIEAEDLDGVPFKLSDYRGKVVMLDFWGNW